MSQLQLTNFLDIPCTCCPHRHLQHAGAVIRKYHRTNRIITTAYNTIVTFRYCHITLKGLMIKHCSIIETFNLAKYFLGWSFTRVTTEVRISDMGLPTSSLSRNVKVATHIDEKKGKATKKGRHLQLWPTPPRRHCSDLNHSTKR